MRASLSKKQKGASISHKSFVHILGELKPRKRELGRWCRMTQRKDGSRKRTGPSGRRSCTVIVGQNRPGETSEEKCKSTTDCVTGLELRMGAVPGTGQRGNRRGDVEVGRR